MAPEQGHRLGAKALRQVAEMIRRYSHEPRNDTPQGSYRSQTERLITVELTSAITPASNPLTGETTFTFELLRGDGAGDLEGSSLTTGGVNRDTNFEADVGDILVLGRVDGEWRPLSASSPAGISLVHGLPLMCLSDGWYVVEIATFADEPMTPTDFLSEGNDCGICDDFAIEGPVADAEPGCTVAVVNRNLTRPTGTGVYCYAHDCDGMPLKMPGHVKMIFRGVGVLPDQGSPSSYGPINNDIYDIVSGTRPMIRFPAKEVWTCCEDGSVVLTSCTTAIVYGIACDPATDTCPP